MTALQTTTFEFPCPDTGRIIEVDAAWQRDGDGHADWTQAHPVSARWQDTDEPIASVWDLPEAVLSAVAEARYDEYRYDAANDL